MLINRILYLCLIGCCISSSYAANVRINLNGTVKVNSCAVSVNSKDKYVFLGSWATKQFFTVGITTMPIQFMINLEQCNGAQSGVTAISLSFDGPVDANNSNLFRLNGMSTAKNVGIALLDENKKIIPPKTSSKIYNIPTNMSSPSFTFYGQYMSTADHVTSGSANADVTFSLTYQ